MSNTEEFPWTCRGTTEIKAKMAAKPSLKLLRIKENKLDGVSFIYRNWLRDLDRADRFPGADKFLSNMGR